VSLFRTELQEDIMDVLLNGAFAQSQFARDFLIGKPARGQKCNIALAWTEHPRPIKTKRVVIKHDHGIWPNPAGLPDLTIRSSADIVEPRQARNDKSAVWFP
jgi:hypothetical protein